MLVVLKTMVDDDANCDAGDSEVNCGDDLGDSGVGDGNSNNETDADYDNGVDSNVDNNANFGERKTKVGCVKDTTSDDLFIYLFSLYLKLTFPSLQLKPINVN